MGVTRTPDGAQQLNRVLTRLTFHEGCSGSGFVSLSRQADLHPTTEYAGASTHVAEVGTTHSPERGKGMNECDCPAVHAEADQEVITDDQ